MKYRRNSLKVICPTIFIWSIFLSDFGVLVAGQPIYLFQIFAFIYISYKFASNCRIEKGWILFFIAGASSAIANLGILAEAREFAGDSYPWTSLKGLVNIGLFYAVYRASKAAYRAVNPDSFLWLAVFSICYGLLELFVSHQPVVEAVLSLLHTNPKALHKGSLSLLGREHSYGALGFLITVCILTHTYLQGKYRGWHKPLAVLCIFAVFAFAVVARSKSAFISILLLVFFAVFLLLRRSRQSGRNFFILIYAMSGAAAVLSLTLASGFHVDIIESISGGVGSGSTFIRFNLLYMAGLMALDNPIFGVGPGNYKLFFVDYILASGVPIILELEVLTDPRLAVGSVDPANFFAGILAEFGAVTFIIVTMTLVRRLVILVPARNAALSEVPLSIIMAPVIIGAAAGFYYWSVSFFPFFLAILALDYERSRLTK